MFVIAKRSRKNAADSPKVNDRAEPTFLKKTKVIEEFFSNEKPASPSLKKSKIIDETEVINKIVESPVIKKSKVIDELSIQRLKSPKSLTRKEVIEVINGSSQEDVSKIGIYLLVIINYK